MIYKINCEIAQITDIRNNYLKQGQMRLARALTTRLKGLYALRAIYKEQAA